MKNRRRHLISILIVGACLRPAEGFARPTSDAKATDNAPVLFLDVHAGYSIYKSELVQSNDTSIGTSYGFGTFAGSDKSLGMAVRRDEASFDFKLNGSKIEQAVQDVFLRYRYAFAYVGVVIAQSEWRIEAPPDADGDSRPDPDGEVALIADAIGLGYGGNAGLLVSVARSNRIKLDIVYAAAQGATESAIEQADGSYTVNQIELGPRLDIDFGGTLELTKRGWLQATAGFRYRSYDVGVLGKTYSELHNSTYLGIRLEADF